MATTRRPIGSFDSVSRLTQTLDISDRILDAGQILARNAQRLRARQPDADKHGIVVAPQRLQCDIATEGLIGAHFDPADGQDEIDLALREPVRRLVRSDAVLVQAGELRPRLEHGRAMAQHRQAVRARESRRTATDYGNALAAGRRALKRLHPVESGASRLHAAAATRS